MHSAVIALAVKLYKHGAITDILSCQLYSESAIADIISCQLYSESAITDILSCQIVLHSTITDILSCQIVGTALNNNRILSCQLFTHSAITDIGSYQLYTHSAMAEILSQSLKKGAQRSLALPRRMRPVKRKSPLSTRIPHLLGARMVPNRKRSSRRRRRNTGVFWWMSCATATSISVWSLFSDASTRCILPTTTVNTQPKQLSTHNQNQ